MADVMEERGVELEPRVAPPPPEELPGARLAEALVEAARDEAAILPDDWSRMELHIELVPCKTNDDGRPMAMMHYSLSGDSLEEAGWQGDCDLMIGEATS